MKRAARRVQKRSRWRDFRGTLEPTGAVLIGVAVAQVLCGLAGAGFEYFSGQMDEPAIDDMYGLAAGAVLTGALGGLLWLYGRRHSTKSLTRREALLTVTLIWLMAGVGGGIPFVASGDLGPVDALFEAVSGMTTTGATVIGDIDGELVKGVAGRPGHLSMPVLLWRSLIQWLGGMGIVVLFVAIFPSVGAGAKHMFKGEVPGTTAEGLQPRIAETSFTLWKLYAALTGIETLLLVVFGMTPFEAICHAMTTMSTGGFSTSDASVAGWNSFPIEMIIATFMLLGSLNYGLYYALLRRRPLRSILGNTELRAFVILSAVFTLILTLGTLPQHDDDLIQSFRYAYFMVGTTMSSTGYGTDDYMAYSQPMLMVIVLMMFIGGCSGSTAGGIKVERIILMAKTSWAEFRESFRPAVVQVVRMGRVAVPAEILRDVAVFVGVFMACLGFGCLFVVSTDDVSLATAFGATLSCLSNMGPAPWHAGPDNFAAYSQPAKLFFVLAMLLGRLEFFTLFALLVPDFWKR
ncbi:MAG: TrkH family potassium uptake protein [Sandaracinaceae bacterium]|nr:TrkH family potassium uptake protein [Sandaracinaceae bacterium]